MFSLFTIQGILPADFLGLFLLIAGFIMGLGAVMVIDVLGFLGRLKPYWTETAIRTHKVTKPLIWIGIIFAFIGGFIFYRNESLSNIPLIHLLFGTLLIANGLFLSFYISPKLIEREQDGHGDELLPASWQAAIAISFIFSLIGWWGNIILLVLYLLGGR